MLRIFVILSLAAGALAGLRHQANQHDQFRDLARGLEMGKVVVALDKDMKSTMLVQIKGPEFSDPCAPIGACGALKCPAGFIETEEPGHCCPYCVNPNIKIDDIVTGPRGIAGGKASFMCSNVWCFPTMCNTGMETMPNS